MSRFATAFVVVAAIALPAAAQPSGAQAEVLFRQGRDLLTAGKIAEACNAFEESQKLEASTSTLINLAGCREKNGQLATAWGLFLDAERQTRTAADAATQQLHQIAHDRAAKLEPLISKLAINVPQTSQFDGLEIKRGDDVVDPALWNRALPIDGGTYTITAHGPGTNTWSTPVTVAAQRDTKTVDIPDLRQLPRDLQSQPGPTAATSPRAPASPGASGPAEGSHGGAARIVPPVAVTVVALGLLGGALAMDLSGNSKYNDAKAATDQATRDSLYSQANTRRYTAEGLLAGGVVAAGVASWLYVRAFHHHDRAEQVARHVLVSPAGFAWTGSF